MNGVRTLGRMSWMMNIAVGLLLTIGVLFVYSACYFNPDPAIRDLYKKQIVWVVIGCVCYAAFALIDYRSLRKVSWWAYGGGLALLIAVLAFGSKVNGARRWLMLLGVSVQPSEVAKVATILVLARRLSRPGVNLGRFKPLVSVFVVAAAPMALILKEPDLGTALLFVPAALCMVFAAGVPLRPLIMMAVVGAVVAGIYLGALFVPARMGVDEAGQERIMKRLGVSAYQHERLAVFFNLKNEPWGAGYNKRQSQIAIGSGGGWGKGYLDGTQNILGFLPRSASRTDFIYSVIAEETGFFGSAIVLGLFGILIVFGFYAGLLSHDKFGRLVCVGLVTMMFGHVFVNIAMTVGMLPITGLPLPLLSYGGTFMVVMMSALGMIQSVYIRSRHVAVVFEQDGLWRAA